MIFGGLDRYIQFAFSRGYEGLELYPIRSLFGSLSKQMLSDLQLGIEKTWIKSLHQSFRSEKTLGDIIRHPNSMLALKAFISMPERNASMQHLLNMQNQIGDVPTVIFPHHGVGEIVGGKIWNEPEYPEIDKLRNRLFQPTANLMHRYQLSSFDQIVDRLVANGMFDGICFDTHHAVVPFQIKNDEGKVVKEYKLGNWREMIDDHFNLIRLVHIRFSSPEEEHHDENSFDDLVNILKGNHDNTTSDMIKHLMNNGYEGDFTVEVPSAVISAARSSINVFFNIDLHRRLTYHLSKLIKRA